MNTSTLNIAIKVDDKGSIKIEKLGKTAKKAGEKGEKSFKGFRGQTEKLKDMSNLAISSLGRIAGMTYATGKKSLESLRKKVEKLKEKTDFSFSSLTKIGAVTFAGVTAGLAALSTGVVAMLASSGQAAKELENLSRLANMGSEDFQKYAFATNSVGVNSEKLADISNDLRDKLGDFIATGGGEFADFFENIAPQVGLTAEQLQKLSGPDALIAVKNAMDQANVSAEEQVFYLESIANDASLLTPLLLDNGAALKEQALRADELGIALSAIEIQQLVAAQKKMTEMSGLVGALKNKVSADLAPAFTEFSNQLINKFTENKGAVDSLATTISVNLLKAFGYALKGVEFFHVGWLSLKTAVPVIVDSFQMGVNIIYNILRGLLFPLDAIFKGIEKVADFVGKEFTNPFNILQTKIDDFGKMTQAVMEDSFQSIVDTKEGYQGLQGVLAENIVKIQEVAPAAKTSADTQIKAQENIASATVKNIKYTESELSSFAKEGTKLGVDMWLAHAEASDEARMRGIQALYDVEHGMEDSLKAIDDALADFFDEIDEASENTTTGMSAHWKTFADDVSYNISSPLTGYLLGEFDTFGDAWDTTWKGMLATVVDTVAQIGATFVVDSLVSAFFHDGTMGLESDEYNAVLKKGEIVVPADESAKIRENLPNGAGFEGMVSATEAYGSAVSAADPFGMSDIGIAASTMGGIAGYGAVGMSGLATTPGAKSFGKTFGAATAGYGVEQAADWGNVRDREGLRDAVEAGYISKVDGYTFAREDKRLGLTKSTTVNDLAAAFNVGVEAVSGFLGFVGGYMMDKANAGIESAVYASIPEITYDTSTGAESYGGGEGFGSDIGDNSDFGGDMGQGGYGDDGDLGTGTDTDSIAHTGGYLAQDEGRIIVQTEEGVLSRKGMANLHTLNNDVLKGSGDSQVVTEIKALRKDLEAALFAIANNTRQTSKYLAIFEAVGIKQEATA